MADLKGDLRGLTSFVPRARMGGLTKKTRTKPRIFEIRLGLFHALCSCSVHGYFVVLFSEVRLETQTEEGEPQGKQ